MSEFQSIFDKGYNEFLLNFNHKPLVISIEWLIQMVCRAVLLNLVPRMLIHSTLFFSAVFSGEENINDRNIQPR